MLYMAPARRHAFTELLAICGERISRSAYITSCFEHFPTCAASQCHTEYIS